jgi:hypothetical protein
VLAQRLRRASAPVGVLLNLARAKMASDVNVRALLQAGREFGDLTEAELCLCQPLLENIRYTLLAA